MAIQFVFHISTSCYLERVEAKEETEYNGIQFDIHEDQVECKVEIDEEDFEDKTEDALCEWLGFAEGEVLYTNYEDL